MPTKIVLAIALICTLIILGWMFLFAVNPLSNIDAPTFKLLAALEGHNTSQVKEAIEDGADPNALIAGRPIVFMGISEGDDYMLRTLVEVGANINGRSKGGQTALHEAAYYGQVEIVKFLLDNGAEVNARDNEGKTPLFYAEEGKEVTSILQQHGATK